MKELRDIKIDLLMGNQNPIIDLFNQITCGIEIICCDVYEKHGQEFIYFVNAKTAEQYHKDGEWIFYQDAKNGEFWCNFATYWTFFESKLGLEYLEIQSITKYLVEEALKREVVTPFSLAVIQGGAVEEALKREVATPTNSNHFISWRVEEALKREVATPLISMYIGNELVEEALKREVATPIVKSGIHTYGVLDALKREA